jgi:iron-sulfur cluster repair protein YtfE (RIC family)
MKTKIKTFMAADHQRLDGMLMEFQRLKEIDQVQARKLFHEFKVGIDRHLAWEEKILFPMIESRTGLNMPGPATITRAAHQEIKKLLEEIYDQVIKKEVWAEALEGRLVEMLLSHGEEEKRILYPWIEQSLGEAEREEALDRMEHRNAGEKKDQPA